MLRDKLLGSDYYEEHFRDIETWAGNFWRGHNQYPHYTHHDVRHSKSIIRHLDEWLQHANPGFNDAELFILLGAVYLHDIGMQCTDDQLLRDVAEIPDNELKAYLDEGVLEKIRKAHSRLSAVMIRKAIRGEDPEGTGLSALASLLPDEYHAIALIAEGHASKIPADAETNEYIGVPRAESVRLQLLQYLLRIGDALDATKTRLNRPYFTPGRWRMARSTTKYHMLKHQYVTNITVSRGAKFTFRYTIPEDEKKHLKIISTCAESPLRRQLHNRRDYFQEHGIPYMGVDSKIAPGPVFQFAMDEDTREVFTGEAVEFHASTDRPFAKLINRKELENRVERAVTWLTKQRENDGGWSRAKGEGSRIACTAKTIVALLDNKCFRDNNSRQYEKEIKEAFGWIMSQCNGSWGFPAKSLDLENTNPIRKSFVHCTSMACYAYCLVKDAGLISGTEQKDYDKKIKDSGEWLNNVAATGRAWGWGNFPGEPERALCGYWSIRALHRMAACSLGSFGRADYMTSFAEYALEKDVTQGLAFSSILLAEADSNIANSETLLQTCLKRLCDRVKPRNGKWPDVAEHYKFHELDLVWTHDMAALGIHALSVRTRALDVKDRLILRESICRLMQQQEKDGWFTFTDETNPITPSYEAINALSKCIDAEIYK